MEKSAENKTTYLIIFIIAAILSGFLLQVAIDENLWRDFIVTEVQIIVTAVALCFLLKKS